MDSVDVYMVTGPTGKRYIGQAVTLTRKGKPHGTAGRWKQHVNAASSNGKEKDHPLKVDIRKYGANAFTVETLLMCNQKDANEYERKAMILWDAMEPNGYNRSTATIGGRVSASGIENMSKAQQGVLKTEEHREKIGKAHVGKKRSAEARENMSDGQKGKRVKQLPKKSGLPRYIEKYPRGGYNFRISERDGDKLIKKTRTFSAVQKYSDKELLEMAVKCRDEYLKEHGLTEVAETSNVLPKFVYRCKDRSGLVVRTPLGGGKHKSKGFNIGDGGSKTEDELIAVAVAYRDSVLETSGEDGEAEY